MPLIPPPIRTPLRSGEDGNIFMNTVRPWFEWLNKVLSTPVTTPDVQDGAITVQKITCTALSAISANIGEVTAGIITGLVIRTAASGGRIELDSTNGLRAFDAGGNVLTQIALTGLTTIKSATSGARLEIDSAGVRCYDAGGVKTVDLASADGSLTSTKGTITGLLIRTATTGGRVEIDSTNGLRAFDSGGNVLAQIAVTGLTTIKSATSGARIEVDSTGLRCYDAGGVKTVDIAAADGSLTCTKGTITGAVVQTAASGARVVLTAGNVIQIYNAAGDLVTDLDDGWFRTPRIKGNGTSPELWLDGGSVQIGHTGIVSGLFEFIPGAMTFGSGTATWLDGGCHVGKDSSNRSLNNSGGSVNCAAITCTSCSVSGTAVSLIGHTHNYATPASITPATIPLAKITGGGADGSITVNAEGIVTGYVAPT